MNPDLGRLIRLQEIDNAVESARRQIAELPSRLAALDARLADRDGAVVSARTRLADSQTARRAIEKDLATVQARLSKFRDQLMEVKTNKEYQAMQHEIAVAESEVSRLEDLILERLLEGDELAAAAKTADADLAAEQASVQEERQALEQERTALERELTKWAENRERIAAETADTVLALFDHVARRRQGIAVTEARDGHCGVCNVRLRPQIFNDVRTNETIIQCESCQRILYFASATVS